MTRFILPRSDIVHCARLRPYLHKKYPFTEYYANEVARSIFAVFFEKLHFIADVFLLIF